MSANVEQRLAELEVRYTLQEDALEQLGHELSLQRQTIDELLRQVEVLAVRLRDLTPSAVAPLSEETPPPHY